MVFLSGPPYVSVLASVLIVVHGAAVKHQLVFLRGSRIKFWVFFLLYSALICDGDVLLICSECKYWCPYVYILCFTVFSQLTSPSPGLTLVMCTSSRQDSSLFEGSEVACTVFSQTPFRARDWNTHTDTENNSMSTADSSRFSKWKNCYFSLVWRAKNGQNKKKKDRSCHFN